MEHDILPMTERGVAAGNKVFGAALLRKSDLSVVIAGTNDETANPLLHGEISTLKQFYEMPDRPLDPRPGVPVHPRTLHAVHVGDHLGAGSTTTTTSTPTRIRATASRSRTT